MSCCTATICTGDLTLLVEQGSLSSSLIPIPYAGVETIHQIGSLSAYEQEALNAMKPELMSSIQKGIDFAKNN